MSAQTGVKWLEVNMVDYYVLAQFPISLNAGSIPATSTNFKTKQMPNMSYCRFENTVTDMRDCINAIEDRETDEFSNYEVNALTDFLDLAIEITNLEYKIEKILEEYED